MNKCKVKNKSGLSQFIIKSLKGQQLNENEVHDINANKVDGLLHLDVVQKGSSFKLIYNITGFVTFKEYLAVPLNKERFAGILQNILFNLKSVERAYFNQQYILMDFNRVMINPATQNIYFIYVPIQFFESGSSLQEFLLNIIQHSSFAPNEDTGYVKDYISILNSGVHFSLFDLEEYINKLSGKKSTVQKNTECPQCHTRLSKGAAAKSIYDPLNGYRQSKAVEEVRRQNNTQGLSEWTTVPGVGSGGTMVLGSEEFFESDYPYLIREKSGEKISINKPSFRIGKEKKYSDYFVSDNNAVSRSHADIITREKRYYIIDLNSTNKTYVDGQAISIEKEVEIFSGAKLRLANEDFIFYIQ